MNKTYNLCAPHVNFTKVVFALESNKTIPLMLEHLGTGEGTTPSAAYNEWARRKHFPFVATSAMPVNHSTGIYKLTLEPQTEPEKEVK